MTDRYARQTLLPWLGDEGQAKLSEARVGIVGLGALGSVSSVFLARAGVGGMLVVDRDFVEETNLNRQILYTEEDCTGRLPKAVAAERRLREIRPDLALEAVNADLDAELAVRFFEECDLILDGTDNFETRYLLNDAAVAAGKPWIYAGAVSTYGSVQVIRPGETACLRCVFLEAPPPGSAPTCDTAGVLGPAVGVVASIQAGEAVKLLAGHADLCPPGIVTVDLMTLAMTRIKVPRMPGCPCCGQKRFDYLEESAGSRTHSMCGRDGIMVLAPKGTKLDLARLEERLKAVAPVFSNKYLLQTEWEGHPITLYADGRALIQKTGDPSRARALYARYLGM